LNNFENIYHFEVETKKFKHNPIMIIINIDTDSEQKFNLHKIHNQYIMIVCTTCIMHTLNTLIFRQRKYVIQFTIINK